ncbi:unnamed protein product [Rotaria sordida]|uniref:Uncharacterized protein n=1 Tax=Rotaria sordida TaxID=392033 RepID=A0A815QM78_9BILA|nr:unnamed protein product [Rotaria sordida]CAF4095217.1 unnamed protein product [Rotaria sordida]
MASSKANHFPSCSSPTTNSLDSNISEALGKSSQSLQLVGDIRFSQISKGRDLLVINSQVYLQCKTRNMVTALI